MDHRIQFRRQSFGGGEVQNVPRSQLIGGATYHISKVSFLRISRQYLYSARIQSWSIDPLVIYKEECFLLERAERNQRPASVTSVVLHTIEEPRQPLRTSAPGIGIESFALRFVKETAMIFVAAATSGEFDVSAALRARIGAEPAGFDRLLFERTQAHRNRHEKNRAAALESIRSIIDSIDRNVDRTAWQVVVSRGAASRRGCSLGKSCEGQCVAAIA